jgi:hypothetical protein
LSIALCQEYSRFHRNGSCEKAIEPEKPTEQEEGENEKDMSNLLGVNIIGQLDFNKLRQWGYT